VRDELETLYGQAAQYFTLRLFIARNAPGNVAVDLARRFLGELVLPPCRPTWLWTGRGTEGAKLNTGDFSERRWSAAEKKLLSGEFAALSLFAAHPQAPSHKISCSVNPGRIDLTCSVSYLRRLAHQKMDQVLRWAVSAWDGSEAVYGYGNLAYIPPREPFDPAHPERSRLPWDRDTPPAQPPHAIPVAWTGADIDGNLERLFLAGKGIKGAFWANFLNARAVAQAGDSPLVPFRKQPLARGGLLIVATDNPLPADSEENRRHFVALHRALQPAFVSLAEVSGTIRPMLGHFYREAGQ
jgi:hypothetical protein